jgi:hypothetical protein
MIRRAWRRLALRGVVAGGLALVCGGCVPIGVRWSNMFAAMVS